MRRFLVIVPAVIAMLLPGLTASGSFVYGPHQLGQFLHVHAASPTLIAFSHGDDLFVADGTGEVIRPLDAGASVVQVNGATVLLWESVAGQPTPCFVAESASGDARRELCSADSAAVVGTRVVYTQGGSLYWAYLNGKRKLIEAYDGLIESAGPKGMVLVRQTGSGPRADYVPFAALADGVDPGTKLALPDTTTLVDCRSVALTRAFCRIGLADGSEWPVLLKLNGDPPTTLTYGRPATGAYLEMLVVSQHTALWKYQNSDTLEKAFGSGHAGTFAGYYNDLASSGRYLIVTSNGTDASATEMETYERLNRLIEVDVRVPGATDNARVRLSLSWRRFLASPEPSLRVGWRTDKYESGTRYWIYWKRLPSSDPSSGWLSSVPKGHALFGVGASPVTVVPGARYEFGDRSVDAFGQGNGGLSAVVRAPNDQTQGSFSGTWKTVSSADDWNGSVAVTHQKGATFRFTAVSGNRGRVVVFGRTGPHGGDFAVFMDGKKVDVVSTSSGSSRSRRILWSGVMKGAGKHTIKLVKLGGKSTSVAIDGFHKP